MTDFLLTALLVSSCLLCAVGIFMLFRNNRVYHARRRLLESIHEAVGRDIEERSAYKWRYDEFDKVSYDRMVRSWRKPESMYDNLDFADPNVRRGNLFDGEFVIRSESELDDES